MRTESGSLPTCHPFLTRALRLAWGLAVSLMLISCRQDGAPGTDIAGASLEPSAAAVAGIELFAGSLGGSGNIDGTGTAARFNNPAGMAIASDGTLYLADAANHVIRRITPGGVVTTFAGTAGLSGATDGNGSAARFRTPIGLALASDGTLYVSDRESHTIRKITPAGEVTTLVGADGQPGSTDATGASARFNAPHALVVGPDGNLYVSDTFSSTIRKITPVGVVTTFAGVALTPGSADGTGSEARFNGPAGLAFDSNDNLIVADVANNMIRKVTLDGVVTTVAGAPSASGSQDGIGAAARFLLPFGIAVDDDDTIYVTDLGNNTVRKITAGGVVTTLAGAAGESGNDDGLQADARFNTPMGIGIDGAGNVLVSDSANHLVRQVTSAGAVTTSAGKRLETGTANGAGSSARFYGPSGLALRSDGSLLVADALNHSLRLITPTATVSTFAGVPGTVGSLNGSAAEARFNFPQGMAVDSSGVVYVADSFNHVIRKIAVDGTVSTLAGQAGTLGAVDGSGSQARFSYPWSLAVDLDGVVYVADAGNHAIRKITPTGVVTTLAGSLGAFGTADGTGSAARFQIPRSIVVGGDGNLYVTDSENHTIRQVTTAGVVTTLAGSAGAAGFADGTGSAARFDSPEALAVDASGNLYVTDTRNSVIRKVTPDKVVTTLVGTAGKKGVTLGVLPGALNVPLGIVIGRDGELYVSDEGGILRINLDTPLSIFNVRLAASATTVVVGNAFTLRWAATDATGCVASGDWSEPQASNGSLTVTPTVEGSLSYTLTCNENGGSGSQARTVNVNVTLPSPVLALTTSATRIDPGTSATLTWSVTNATSCTASGGHTGDGWAGSKTPSSTPVTFTFTPTATATYTLSCTGSGGTTVKSVPVTVAYAPTLTFTAKPRKLVLGEKTTLTWASAHATTCTASGSWTGPQATSGSVVIRPGSSVAQTYTLSCAGDGGVVSDTMIVEVSYATTVGGSSGGSGGAAGLDLLLGAGALVMLRRLLGLCRPVA